MARETSAASKPNPRVGVGVFIVRHPQTSTATTLSPDDVEFLLGRRKGSTGAGTWALPGGHLEFGESFNECAARETLEETGLSTAEHRYLTVTNDVFVSENKHYATVFVVCQRQRPSSTPVDDDDGEEPKDMQPVVMEPDKCERWDWVRWGDFTSWAKKQAENAKEENTVTINGEKVGVLFLPMVSLLEQRPGINLLL